MTNWSGLWDRQYGEAYQSIGAKIGMSENTNEFSSTIRDGVAKELRVRGGRPLARLMYVLTGAVAGTTATETLSQLTSEAALGNPLGNGGVRTVAAVNLVNRASTAADVTYVKDVLTRIFGPVLVSGYPTVLGSGGGGKVGGF